MEDIGPEVTKRPRLDSFGATSSMHRSHQQHPESPLPLHTYQGQALRPPSAYSQPLPPSPYESAGQDHRNLPEPPPHSYTHPHSGYNTPIRDSRPYQPEPAYSRHGSVSAPRRSPEEGAPLTALRPLNTSSANEGQHYAHHSHSESGGHPGGPTASYVPHEVYANGTAHGLPMSTPHDQAHRPPPLGHMGGYSDSPVGTGPSPYSAGPYGPPSDWAMRAQVQRKNTRAQQACDTCRNRKAKCDEGKPMCGYCRDNNQNCRYKEVAPPKADRAQKEIMDQLKALNDKIDHLTTLPERVTMLETRLDRPSTGFSHAAPALRPSLSESDIRNIPMHSDHGTPEKKPLFSTNDSIIRGHDMDEQHVESHVLPSGLASSGEGNYGSIAIDHTTGAHRLLRWPTIKALLKYRPVSEDYVMETEEKKGLLRLYGRGQGRDLFDGGMGGPTSPATSASSGRSDDTSRSPAASPPDIWGTAFYPTPGPTPGPDARPSQDHPGGLNPDGTLKLDTVTMSRLLESYMGKLHILHPFLNRTRLSRMFQKVNQQANQSDSSQMRSPFLPHAGATWQETALNRSTKRKHADSPNDTITTASRNGKEQALERRISTAIVLLVMALGKICEHKGPLPGPVPENPRDNTLHLDTPYYTDSPPGVTTIKPSPTPSTVSMTSPPSEFRASINSRRSSTDPQGHQLGFRPERNVDVIPGLAYYTRATEILGNLNGGQDLMHVQANLLANLYTSQLGCVLESWTWIQNACRACHFLIRDPTLRKESDLTRADMIRFAYWTCLQFESDILAELDLRRSGIERAEHESEIQYPNGVSDDSTNLGDLNKPEGIVLAYYSFQISLRTTLNKIQTILYPPGANQSRISLSARDECEQMLEDWLKVLPPQLRWNDTDPPATDINVARLRAKYYGARYIISRPFLNCALHSQSLREPLIRQVESLPYPNFNSPHGRHQGTMAPPTRIGFRESDQVKEILRSAEQCIDAAMRSTEAFDGVRARERLVVTNIFGTAHAQFGNMLVLAATYRSHLGRLVDKHNFIRLLDRTIGFLRELAPISTTLETDATILISVKRIIMSEEHQATSSFSSTHS